MKKLYNCVSLAQRYITDREFPDKAIDILDEVGAKVQIDTTYPKSIEALKKKISEIKKNKMEVVLSQNYEKAAEIRDNEKTLIHKLQMLKTKFEEQQEENRITITVDDIFEVVSEITKIPLSRLDANQKMQLLGLELKLQELVIGQNEPIEKICKAIRRNSVGIKDVNKPIGSFIFLGPTGVGKTYLAKKLSEEVFGTEDSIIRVDMSEFQEKHSMSRLIGSPPGYVGYNEGGQLTEKVRNNPYSLVLFDEIEKAHNDIFNMLLQILDDGYVTDSSGRKINFKNTLIIMTSNLGIKSIQDFGDGIGFETKSKKQASEEHARSIISKALKNTFNPEFLNRLDDIVTFGHLEGDNINKIVKLELKNLKSRLLEKEYDFNFGPTLVNFISEIGYNKQFGARPLKRAIQSEIEDYISEEILKGGIKEGGKYVMSYNKKTEKVKLKSRTR